jgi:hypothetical protein
VTVTDVLEPGTVTVTDVLDPGTVGRVAMTGTLDDDVGVEALIGLEVLVLVAGSLDEVVLRRAGSAVAADRKGGSVCRPPTSPVARVRPAPAMTALPRKAATGTTCRRESITFDTTRPVPRLGQPGLPLDPEPESDPDDPDPDPDDPEPDEPEPDPLEPEPDPELSLPSPDPGPELSPEPGPELEPSEPDPELSGLLIVALSRPSTTSTRISASPASATKRTRTSYGPSSSIRAV